MMKKCPMCGGSVRRTPVNHPYAEAGLPNVLLQGVERYDCDGCDELSGVAIPAIEELHRLLARMYLRVRRRLRGNEIRFLRKHLGWSGRQFAEHMNATPETVSRWESGERQMSIANQRLLLLYVASVEPVESYSVEDTEGVGEDVGCEEVAVQTIDGRWPAELSC